MFDWLRGFKSAFFSKRSFGYIKNGTSLQGRPREPPQQSYWYLHASVIHRVLLHMYWLIDCTGGGRGFHGWAYLHQNSKQCEHCSIHPLYYNLPPFSLIHDFRKQNTRWNVSKIYTNVLIHIIGLANLEISELNLSWLYFFPSFCFSSISALHVNQRSLL